MGNAQGDTLQQALFYSRHVHYRDTRCMTVAILIHLGLSTRRIGFEYLIRTILLFYEDPARAHTQELYCAVAERLGPGVDGRQVEAAIRAVIAEAWEHKYVKVWKAYFPPYPGQKLKKPTNMEFISRISYFLELWDGCREEVMCDE